MHQLTAHNETQANIFDKEAGTEEFETLRKRVAEESAGPRVQEGRRPRR